MLTNLTKIELDKMKWLNNWNNLFFFPVSLLIINLLQRDYTL